ncbi:MAG: GNAT family N-acetyltransferase [Geitlerinemataceae cyanobacterium]
MLPQTIQTTRLQLRKPVPADAGAIFATYGQDPAVSKYMVWRPLVRVAEAEQFIGEAIADWESQRRFAYVLDRRDRSRQTIGMLDARLEGHIIDVGYVLARDFWGRGLMPEALSAFVAIALERESLFRVQATCDVDNLPSIRTLEKCGFSKEGRLDRYTLHPNISGEPRPCFMFARCR